ncbi:enoyl-CoA hydratase/isomerase family protein [Corynebacterium aurimucosum]|uniref:Enoyl-CoA hydratase/isomerase family protein n=1 Tax=Corynebacterium aurimucosum TaxID=169292 RepID=A0A558GLK0_9CORY|nr:enoyl-CoA hydratase/isomerase family protein [Corynebacterium aurimucosum]
MSNNENSTNPANVVESSHESGIGIITINRPRQFNALNTEVLNAINSVLDKWESCVAVQAVIFTGAGDKAFAAGADIKELSQLSPWQVVNEYPMAELYKRIESYPKPTVAAVNGLALGGGFELALSCDIRIADPQSRFAFPELD